MIYLIDPQSSGLRYVPQHFDRPAKRAINVESASLPIKYLRRIGCALEADDSVDLCIGRLPSRLFMECDRFQSLTHKIGLSGIPQNRSQIGQIGCGQRSAKNRDHSDFRIIRLKTIVWTVPINDREFSVHWQSKRYPNETFFKEQCVRFP